MPEKENLRARFGALRQAKPSTAVPREIVVSAPYASRLAIGSELARVAIFLRCGVRGLGVARIPRRIQQRGR